MKIGSRFLSCPVIRQANPDDAEELADLVINSNSSFINSVFAGDMKGGREVLRTQFSLSNEGLYVLTEADQLIGIMKLHLPDQLLGDTISFRQLISILGIRKGIRAGILLSHWDEYKPKPEEAYIEYLYVHSDWQTFNVIDLLLERAYLDAHLAGATYVTHFIPVTNHQFRDKFSDEGFIFRRKIHSPLAKLMGANHSAWYKATYSIAGVPITVKEYVADKIDVMKQMWQARRREIFAAIRITIAMTIIPLIAGSLAYIRGYPAAAIGWSLIVLAHLVGVRLYLRENPLGRYGLIVAMFSEGINLLSRAIMTESWFDRFWLLPLSMVTFWIVGVLIRNPSVNTEMQLTTA